jgi:hypothetical protein
VGQSDEVVKPQLWEEIGWETTATNFRVLENAPTAFKYSPTSAPVEYPQAVLN